MRTGWMWMKERNPKENVFAEFRTTLLAEQKPKHFVIRISADSRYKLYINDRFVECGPSKGNDKIWYYDEFDIADRLSKGQNEICVWVLHYSTLHGKGNYSVFRTETPGLYFDIVPEKESQYVLKEWKCREADERKIDAENPYFAPLWIYEKAGAPLNGKVWETPVFYKENEISDVLKRSHLKLRTIPYMERAKKSFQAIENFCVEAGGKAEILLDAGELVTAFYSLKIAGGKDAEIELLQSECFAGEIVVKEGDPYGSLPKKGNRTDSSQKLYGYTDSYEVQGSGTAAKPEIYEPFWMRTFRYIRVTIRTKTEPLVICGLDYEETGYPLRIKSHVETSDSRMEKIWDISARSLKRCMQETYVDCPFYEQLQYAMDARSQILYTYAIAADSRLAIKCMDDFANAVRGDGMINCCYPNYEANVIPGFGIYYIGIVYDYMMYFGDKVRLRKYLETIKGILEYFEKNCLKNGLVGKIGDLNRPGYDWSFIDWTKEWDATNGVPPCTKQGPITMESLLYILGLVYASEIEGFLGHEEQEKIYEQRKQRVQDAVRKYCIGANGMIQDGPRVEEYSQHCQVFGVLADVFEKEEGKGAVMETLQFPGKYAQCSIAMSYYLFRALEKCEIYDQSEKLWDIWDDMVRDNLTTCAEDTLMQRSDCHAWGALALYELPSVILGVHPGKPGYEEVVVHPLTDTFSWAKGEVVTPRGMVAVNWKKKKDGTIDLQIENKN